MSQVKSESLDSPIQQIKPENVDLKMETFDADDDVYEDTGDLDFSSSVQNVWMVKLPRYIAERWSQIDDEEEITLGHVKISKGDPEQQQLKLFLERNAINGDVPIEYQLNIKNMEVINEYVFTEQDLPGYGRPNTRKGEPSIPQHLLYARERERESRDLSNGTGPDRHGRNKIDRKPYTRKAIPKRTSLVATVRHLCDMVPADNAYLHDFEQRRIAADNAPKRQTRLLDDLTATGNLLAPGTTGAASRAFSGFVRPSQAARKPTDPKAVRMEKSDLLDSLFQLFNIHEFWGFKQLKHRLQQPEAYLKQTLEEVAVMNKVGPYSGKWSLKSEYTTHRQNATTGMVQVGQGAASGAGTAAPDVIEIDEEDEEDFDDVPLIQH